jgi:hypothetical protein
MHPKQRAGWQRRETCPRAAELMHSNELHPGGKLSQDDVKTLLFTAIIFLLRETLGAGIQRGSLHQENANPMHGDGI